MIKRLFLSAMLTLCAAGAMAQGEKVLENANYLHNNSNDYFYALYSDRTAILKNVYTACSNTYEIPVIITVGSNEYKVTEVAEKAFENIGIPSNDNIEVKIYGTDIKLCADPFGSNLPTDKGTTTNLHASPCLDVSIWNSYFTDVYKDLIPNVEDFFPCEIEYNSGGDYILQPFDINTDFYGLYTGFSGETYTLTVEQSKITSIDIETQFVNPSDIAYDISVEKALLKNSAGKVCEELDYTGGHDIADAVIVKEGEIREIKEKNVLVCTDLKFYPTPGSSPSSDELSIVSNVMSGSHPDRPSDKTLEEWLTMGEISNDYVALTNQVVVLADDFKRDTIALPCTAEFVIDGNKISLKITIAKDAEGVGSYGDAPYGKTHYQTNNYKPKLNLSKNAEFLFSLKGTYPVFVNRYKYKDPANNIDGPLEDISETIGSGLKEFTKTFFRVDDKACWYGLFIDYSEPDYAKLTKTYNNSETMDVPDGKTPVMMKKRRFNPAFVAAGVVDNVFMSKLNYDENVEIEADYTLKFADPYVGTNKEITLTIIPRDPFYRALLGDNNTVTLKGTITPMQLSETDIAGIETLIKKALEPTKIVDGTSDINCSQKELTYKTEKYTVNVTINEAKYLMSEKEVSTPGSGYDMKVTYEVDHNFCFGSTQTGYEYQKSVIFNNEGEIRQTPSVSNDDFATAFKAKYKNYLSKTYDGTTNFLGFNPQDDVLSVTVGSATDAVAAQIKITSVAYDEKDAGTRSLKVECTPVQGSPYTISSPVTITGDDIKITPFVLDNIADYVKEDEHFKKDKTYNGYTYVEMNNPVFTIPGVTVNGTQETVDGGTIADAIYTKDGAEVSAVGDDYTITATLSIRVDRNYCLGIDNSGNYIYGNTFIIGTGSITPAELDIQFAPEDLEGKVSLTRKYNQADASAEIKTAKFSKNGHNFIITDAKFADNSVGENKQIVVTIQLNDGNNNYTLKNSTVIIPDGTILGNDAIIIKEGSIQQNPNHQQAYCIEGVNGLELKFQRVAGDIKSFKIKVDGDEKLSEIMSTDGKIKGDTLIYVNIPSNTMPGKYSGTIQFFGEDEKYASDPYKFDFIVDMPPSMVKYLYHNVIFVDNHDTLFTEYQWYKNGEKIEGATRQYYYEKTLDGEYYVACKHNSGISLHSCPVKGEVSTKVSVSSVKVYPNPAQANIPFNLELVGGNGNYAGAEMMIYNNSGNLVKHITNITDIITLTLPQGNYSGALFFNGEKTGFKIIVK